MEENLKKKVDESWKDQVDSERKEKSASEAKSPSPSESLGGRTPGEDFPEARLDLFISGLAMESLIALGDMPHPQTKKQSVNLENARYLIDTLGVLEEKTKGNLTVDEEKLLTETLYQLRMRYMSKSVKINTK